MRLESIQTHSYNTKNPFKPPTFKALRVGTFECANEVVESIERALPREAEFYKQNINIKLNPQILALRTKLCEYFKCNKNYADSLLNAKLWNFAKLDQLLDMYINKDIAPLCFASILDIAIKEFSDPDYDGIEQLFKFREKALKHKQLLSVNKQEVLDRDVDALLFIHPDNAIETLNILGEKAFLYAFKDKKVNLANYIWEIGTNYLTKDTKDMLVQLTNPTKSNKYKEYQIEIRRLKDKYKSTTEEDERKQLQNEINTLTFNRNKLVKDCIKDPKTILDTALIVCSTAFDMEECEIILEEIAHEKDFSSEKLGGIIQNNFYDYIGIKEPPAEVKKRLQIKDPKYLIELFKSNVEFGVAFNKLIQLMESAPEKSNKELFDSLPENIKTRKKFEKLGLDYDKWCDSTPHTITTDEGYTFRKVDMNDIPYALFLGNYSDCCTRTNGRFSFNSVLYIKYKMFQAIEILDKNDKPIGNTMCYIALLDGSPSLILDNIEMHPSSKGGYDDSFILTNMAKVARSITTSIGSPEMPIYLSAMHNDINTLDLPHYDFSVAPIGSTGDTLVYFDYARHTIRPEKEDAIATFCHLDV